MTLDQLVNNHIRNAYVTEPGFKSLYVRYTQRYIQGEVFLPTLDIALIEARHPGHGAFTKLLTRLRKTYPSLHIYVENVFNPRFAKKLESLGFKSAHPDSYFLPCFYPIQFPGERICPKNGNAG